MKKIVMAALAVALVSPVGVWAQIGSVHSPADYLVPLIYPNQFGYGSAWGGGGSRGLPLCPHGFGYRDIRYPRQLVAGGRRRGLGYYDINQPIPGAYQLENYGIRGNTLVYWRQPSCSRRCYYYSSRNSQGATGSHRAVRVIKRTKHLIPHDPYCDCGRCFPE